MLPLGSELPNYKSCFPNLELQGSEEQPEFGFVGFEATSQNTFTLLSQNIYFVLMRILHRSSTALALVPVQKGCI